MYRFLQEEGHRLGPEQFVLIDQETYLAKVNAAWRKGVNYVTGEKLVFPFNWVMSASVGAQDIVAWSQEDELGQALSVLGFTYGSYRMSTNSGQQRIQVEEKKSVQTPKGNGNQPVESKPQAQTIKGKVNTQKDQAVLNGDKKASGAEIPKDYLQTREYWKNDIEFKGTKVYQRDGIIDINKVDVKGRSNLQRMEQGLAPLGPDGNPVNLHHMTQRDISSIAEVEQSFHQSNSRTIHINPNSVPSGIDRKSFNKWRSDYWKNRAKDFK